MRLVERCEKRPLHCAIFPTLGARHHRGYVDTETNLHFGSDDIVPLRVYLSIEGLEQVALKFLDVVRRDEFKIAQERITDLEHKLRAAEDELREADKFAEAAEYTLRKFDQNIRNKPGRKPKAPVD